MVKKAISIDPLAFEYASDDLKLNKEFLVECIIANKNVLRYIPSKMIQDGYIINKVD